MDILRDLFGSSASDCSLPPPSLTCMLEQNKVAPTVALDAVDASALNPMGELQVLEHHEDIVRCLCRVGPPGSSLIASAGDDGTVVIWDHSVGRRIAVLHEHTLAINDLLSLSATLLASASTDKTIRVRSSFPFESQHHESAVSRITSTRSNLFSPAALESEHLPMPASAARSPGLRQVPCAALGRPIRVGRQRQEHLRVEHGGRGAAEHRSPRGGDPPLPPGSAQWPPHHRLQLSKDECVLVADGMSAHLFFFCSGVHHAEGQV